MNKGFALNETKGFTFIEMLIAVMALLIVLPAIFTIVFVILQQQIKTYRISTVKREGDYAMTSIKNILRNRIYRMYSTTAYPFALDKEICGASETSYSDTAIAIFEDLDNDWFSYDEDSGRIASASAIHPSTIPEYLTSSNVKISAWTVTCSRQSQFAPAIISVQFDICFKGTLSNCPTSRTEEIATLHYQSYVTLRNL